MRKAYISFVAVFVGVLITALPAWAACAKRDLAGNYQLYVSFVEAGMLGWTRCTLVVDNKGNVKSGTQCRDFDGFAFTITGGSLAITSSCKVTGNITDSDGDSSVIDHAQFDLSRAILTGVGHDVGDSSDTFTFTALRR